MDILCCTFVSEESPLGMEYWLHATYGVDIRYEARCSITSAVMRPAASILYPFPRT